MNGLLRIRETTPICGLVPFKYLMYAALVSDIRASAPEDDGFIYALSRYTQDDVYDYYSDCWDVEKALNELSGEGLVLFFEDSDDIAVGEIRGKKFFPFEKRSSLFDTALSTYRDAIREYGSSGSAKDRSRALHISGQVDILLDKGVDSMGAGDFTRLHGYLYEIYTGGEIYIPRSKTEYYQTSNMLKAYDRHTVFAILVEGVLHYGMYRNKGVPTLTAVACMKDDVFAHLALGGRDSKDYMRDSKSMDSEF